MPRRLPIAISSMAAALLSIASPGRGMADSVELIPNSTIKAPGNVLRGPIQSESATEVKINGQSVPVDQIASVTYDASTPSFSLAQSREKNGNLTEAADLYKKAMTEATGRANILQAAQYGRAHALADYATATAIPAKITEAIAELDAFVKAHPTSWQYGPALTELADLSLQSNNLPKAEGAINDLAKLPWAADHAAILRARVLGRQDKFDQAVAELDKIIAAAPPKSAKGFQARLAKAESLAGLKKYAEAESAVREAIADVPIEDAPSQASAHNTLGDCLRAAGRPKDALMEYLQTDILFDRDKEQHQKALSKIAQAWRDLKQDGRADETMERLKTLYPTSPYLTNRAPR